jgi:hypothetical protein
MIGMRMSIGRRLMPSFLRPTPRHRGPGIRDASGTGANLGELFKPFVTPMRPIQQDIGAISAKYGRRIEPLWKSSADSQSAARKALRIARREARSIDRRLDRLDPLVSRFERSLATTLQALAGLEEGLVRKAGGPARLLVVRRDIGDFVGVVRLDRTVDAGFESLMTDIQGRSAELNAVSKRGAALAARTSAVHDKILEFCERLLATADRVLGR